MFPKSLDGFVHDSADHKRSWLGKQNPRNQDIDFPEYTRCLIPDPNLQESFLLLPVPILKSNLEHAETEQIAYWASRALKIKGAAHNRLVAGPNVFRFGDFEERHIVDRKQLLILGECRVLAQRCHENDNDSDHYEDYLNLDIVEQLYGHSIWEFSTEEIKDANKRFDQTNHLKTNCQNYFKQFWPQLYQEMFDV